MTDTRHVFISYSHHDGRSFADILYTKLESEQIPVWMDVHSIGAGVNWPPFIQEALDTAACVLSVLTPDAIKSSQIQGEQLHTIDKKVSLISVIAEKCEVPYFLKPFHYIDFTDPDTQSIQFEYLIKQLRQILGNFNPLKDNLKAEKNRIKKEAKTPPHPKAVGLHLSSIIDYFEDREKQLKAISKQLAEPATRIVSVIGPGGRGKTALVSKLLNDLEKNRWPHIVGKTDTKPVDGILYLSTTTNGISLEQLYRGCIEMIGGEEAKILQNVWKGPTKPITKISKLLESLNRKTYVILMDNLEDLLVIGSKTTETAGNVIDADIREFFVQSLKQPNQSRLLITSREPLIFGGMDEVHNKEVPLTDGLPNKNAIAMLRKLDPNGYYGLKKASYSQLIRVVQRVQGDPRALEVFAGWVKDNRSRPLKIVIDEFIKLSKTTEELIRNNYKRLDENTRQVLEALAVLEKPVPIVAVHYLLKGIVPSVEVDAIMMRLLNIHMVYVVDEPNKLMALNPVDRAIIYGELLKEAGGKE